jgi:hypothetical protein
MAADNTAIPLAAALTTLLAVSVAMLTFLIQRFTSRERHAISNQDWYATAAGVVLAGVYTTLLGIAVFSLWPRTVGNPHLLGGSLSTWKWLIFGPPIAFGVLSMILGLVWCFVASKDSRPLDVSKLPEELETITKQLPALSSAIEKVATQIEAKLAVERENDAQASGKTARATG